MNAFSSLLKRDLQLAFRQGSGLSLTVTFFVIVVTLFPLAIGPDLGLLRSIGAGILWVGALLSCLLTLDRLFQADFEDGSLDLLMTGSITIEALVLAKAIAHWISSVMPIIIISPLLALSLDMPVNGIFYLLLALLIGTPALSLIGTIGAALTVGMRRSGALLSLLILPLYIPVLIFGVSAVEAAIGGYDILSSLSLLGAVALGALVFSPLAAAAALRLALE
jgi:heme exporter protein B